MKELNRVMDFASLTEVMDSNHAKAPKTRPIVAVTFDDGFDLNRSSVMEILARYGVCATTFVITSCIDNENLMWRHKLSAVCSLAPEETCVAEYNVIADRLCLPRIGSSSRLMRAASGWDMKAKDMLATELWERCKLPSLEEYLSVHKPYFSWDGLREWLARGHSVGFHTHSHPYCSRLRREELESELIEPAQKLRDKLELKNVCLSYPFGDRLPAELENELFAQGKFAAFFGIGGLTRKGTSNQKLERVAAERDGVPGAVFTRSLLNWLA
jgi:peptidoglycan/xylan/chitin deacetylase (PgdA/CDA1 family)